ncbi:MAG: ATP-binding protein [Candidatus Zixiibacteriota bacterium]
MSLTARIRIYLVLVAVLPCLAVMAVIYFHSVGQFESMDQRQIHRNVERFNGFFNSTRSEMRSMVTQMTASSDFQKAIANLKAGRMARSQLDPRPYGLDFLEITDSSFNVLATFNRPGLMGQPVHPGLKPSPDDSLRGLETVEYDIEGPHASFTFVRPLGSNLYLYTGKYIQDNFERSLAVLLDATVEIHFADASGAVYERMDPGSVYKVDQTYQALLSGGSNADYYMIATFATGADKPIFLDLLTATGVVALVSILAAIGLGMYITGRAKREIDNLVSATSRVASGDFSSPVMAYEEGEFSQLADSFSDMMLKLRDTQKRLATSEKIAAWQSVGRKIAHEVKNPLTPISISIDDLRRSHAEGQPNFDKILTETTTTIKSEVQRLTKLLDQFVGFARMQAPEITTVNPTSFVESIAAMFKREIEDKKLRIVNASIRTSFAFDPDAIKQVIINLVKNGFESDDFATVAIGISDVGSQLEILIEDTGPGFPPKKLENSFEPYVTTKKDGSGLGLVICHRIVHDHGGTMELFNRIEEGGGVRIHLPQ